MDRLDEFMIVVAGVCGVGKSTLVEGLKKSGYHAHTVAQEHSGVPTMWQMTNPNMVILLKASLDTIRKRRKIGWGEKRYNEQLHRLRGIINNAHLTIDTDDLSVEEVLAKAVEFLREARENNDQAGAGSKESSS